MSNLQVQFGKEFAKGEILFREGEHGKEMFVIHAGTVRISKQFDAGEHVIAILGPGDFFGELAVLNNKPRTATAQVTEKLSCLVLDASRLETILSSNGEIALKLLKKFAKRLDSANSLIEILMEQDPKARVILSLSRHAESYGEECLGGIRLRVTKAELCQEVSCLPAVVDEVLQKLSRLQLVDQDDDGNLVVADVEQLRDFLELLEMPPSVNVVELVQ
jgi:CRP/FNR family transcriptional regulator, cyclic AMP receptor protein